MNKQLTAIPIIFAMIILIFAGTSTIQPVNAAWYTVNNNPQFVNGNDWQADIWTQPNMYHTYSMGAGYAYTRFAGWNGINHWGNTEYEQGTDFWATYGNFPYPIPLTATQQLQTRSRITESHVDYWFGVANAYVNLWVTFTSPTGSAGLTRAEILIYLKTAKGVFYPFQGQNTYTQQIRSDAGLTWYLIAYRGYDIGTSFTTRTFNLNAVINRLSTVYGVDLSKGTVNAVTFGIEGAQGEMASEWDYVNYQVNM